MMAAVFAFIVLAFAGLTYATFLDRASSSTSERIVALFEKFQSDPSFYDFDTIVKCNPIPWKGFKGYLKDSLVQKYFDRFDYSDFDSFIDSYKVCRRAGELETWLENLKNLKIYKKLEYSIIITSLYVNDVGIEELTQDELERLSKFISTAPTGITVSLGDVIGKFDRDFKGLAAFEEYSMALTNLLASKKYLIQVLKHAIKSAAPGSGVLLIEQILPMLDAETRRDFIDFLGNAGSDYGSSINQSIEAFNYKLAAKCENLEPLSNSDTYLSKLLLSIDELVGNILSFVEWRTLIQSVPCVCKRFNLIVTKEFMIKHSIDLEQYTREPSVDLVPYQMALTYPWNRLFTSSHQLIKYTVLKSQDAGHEILERWLLFIHHGLAEKDKHGCLFGTPAERSYPDNALLRDSVLAELHLMPEVTFRSEISNDDIVRILDIFFDSLDVKDAVLDQVYASLHYTFEVGNEDKLPYLLKNTKNGARLFHLARRHWESLPREYNAQFLGFFNYAIAAILLSEDLKMPDDVTKEIKEYVKEKYGKVISVPMTAEERNAQDFEYPEILSQQAIYLNSRMSCKLLIKILSFHADDHSIESWRDTLYHHSISSSISYILLSDPKLMTIEQFKALITIAPPMLFDLLMEGFTSALRISFQNS